MSALIFALVFAQDAATQEKQETAPPKQEERQETPPPLVVQETAPSTMTVGARFQWWTMDLAFEVETANTRIEIDSESLAGFELWGRWDLSEEWAFGIGVDYGSGLDTESLVLSLGATWRLAPPGDPWVPFLRAGVLYGSLDVADLPGEFEAAFGAEGGAGVSVSLGDWIPGLALSLEAAARWITFDFDPGAGVISSDPEVGGFGLRLLAGIELRF